MKIPRTVRKYVLASSLFLSAGAAVPQAKPMPPSAAAELHAAVSAASAGDNAKAMRLADALLTQHPAFAPALKFKAALMEDAGHQAEADNLFRQALVLAPKDSELLFSVGLADLRQQRYGEAATLLEQGTRLAPQDAQMYFYLAQADHLSGHDDAAIQASRRSVELEPADAAMQQKLGELWLDSGNTPNALLALGRAEALDPTLDRLNYDLALASLREENLDAAAAYAKKAAGQDATHDRKLLRLRAEIAVKLGQWSEAKLLFRELLLLDPYDSASELELGHSELALKQYAEAVSQLQHVIAREPTTILAHFYLSRAYAGLGDKAAAEHESALHNQLVASSGSVVPADQRAAEAQVLLRARRLLEEGNQQGALLEFQQHMKGPMATPGEPSMLVGVSYLYMGRPSEAERWLNKALAIESGVHDAHTYLGLLALERNDLDGAQRHFNAELDRFPDDRLAISELGDVQYRRGNWAGAQQELIRSRTVSPALLLLLIDSDFRLGQSHDALLTAELAAGYAHDDPIMLDRIVALLRSYGQGALAGRISARRAQLTPQ